MLKNIVNLNGTKKLNRTEQNRIKGGGISFACRTSADCPPWYPFCDEEVGFCRKPDF
ncbi:hypothetical protein [Aquimarina sp. 2201CG5-10]|uniref:hypothetical protein n=1 Tax=Aquimarina callyspongiae TaxID=3098150 RepID=UPI002AB40A68|nr:hypothetical protein [Aquimarina sp. 2201CG5-10]MDY8138124.1 hypothetical protein [Aquimarina sp. 2201CG5-10]